MEGHGEAILLSGDAHKSLGDRKALTDVDLDVRRGEAVVRSGPSGCGKSAPLRRAIALEEIDGGEVTHGGASPRPFPTLWSCRCRQGRRGG